MILRFSGKLEKEGEDFDLHIDCHSVPKLGETFFSNVHHHGRKV